MASNQRFTTLLAILQQSEYDLNDFSRWYQKHAVGTKELAPVEVEKWTPKLKLIQRIAQALAFLPEKTQLSIATQLTLPIENTIRAWTYARAQRKLSRLRKKGLIVVAIAGSYAKTSTKNIMHHLLSSEKKVLITPKSINTLLGISQVILEDLMEEHDICIVEFGEYNQEDVKHLTAFTKPDFAVLTPIGRQHLERFGSLSKIANTFLPLINHFKTRPADMLIASQNATFFDQVSPTYGEDDASDLAVENISVSRRGTEFSYNKSTIFSPLFGAHQAVNTLPSFWLATKIDIPETKIVTACASIPYISRRHEPHFGQNDVLILDNSYNTNPDSVQASLALMHQLKPTKKIIITPGFVELGAASEQIHTEFGKTLAKEVDAVGLLENSSAHIIKNSFIEAGGDKSQIVIADSIESALQKLSAMIIPGSVVLFEGGYREIYDT